MKIINAFRWNEGYVQPCEIRIVDGVIAEIGHTLSKKEEEAIFDAEQTLLAPGFTDVHVHLREPGGEHKETIETGTNAAVKGGFTTICPMPNTNPVPDSEEKLEELTEMIRERANCEVLPYVSITKEQQGHELTDMRALKEAGAFAFTDDGVGVQSAAQMKEAMKKASQLHMPVVAHCEDNSLAGDGVVHEGDVSKRLGLPGIPSSAEAVHIARDVLLAAETGCHYHVCHVSAKGSVQVIRNAKQAGIHVTAEVTPHHLILSEKDVTEDDAMFKMNPPLRSEEDKRALIEGLEDGTIDFIATDHAPHAEDEKKQSMKEAPFGITGLETAFPLLYTHFVATGKWSLGQLIAWMTSKPRKVFSLNRREIEPLHPATFAFIDVRNTEVIDRHAFVSKGKNTPFDGREVSGIPVCTMIDGKTVWKEWKEK
ncbi:dihydroorotase [Salimicrobium halophilum]|uniref:Dihydroorotase n=1 Tax=Salimicrobium halophilum TaxID=86666 RepID=A0A1G8QEX9_9BACI|nr:dihydroorotase [Salimicrobium halophilum]SDJ03188.1 dihydroorotase [Salimicrobium halophilum]